MRFVCAKFFLSPLLAILRSLHHLSCSRDSLRKILPASTPYTLYSRLNSPPKFQAQVQKLYLYLKIVKVGFVNFIIIGSSSENPNYCIFIQLTLFPNMLIIDKNKQIIDV